MPMKFSPKQKCAITWWRDTQKHAIICDGAVRSGKTLSAGLGFFLWSTATFREQNFAICGKTAGAVRRNLLVQAAPLLRDMGFVWREKLSRGYLEAGFPGGVNRFYLFGGKDESSAALIQGMTLAGAFLDEVALMPRSFVEQTCARCSVEGAKLWFSCNPDSPEHWFYKEWIQKQKEKNALYLHFTMEDNPTLSQKTKERFQNTFHGTFYRRFILGEWVAAEGLVYDFFPELPRPHPPMEGVQKWAVSCDYGTVNPTSMGLWAEKDGLWYRVEEYYYDSKKEGRQKTDGEYADDLLRLLNGRVPEAVVVDPSAASFIEVLRRRGLPVRKADNDVLSGIRLTADLLRREKLLICNTCSAAEREFALYRWADGGQKDQVVKQHDHAMDEIRYFAATVAAKLLHHTGVAASTVRRSLKKAGI